MRKRSFIIVFGVLVGLSASREALACPVCFGASDSPTAVALNWAILFLLGLTGTVLGGFVAFFVHLAKRAKLARQEPWVRELDRC